MAERPAVNRQVIGSSPIAGAPGGARRKRTGGPDRVPAPGCKKDGESGREHLAKALSWRRPAGPYRPRAHLRSRVAQWQSGRLLTGRLLVRVQSREQYEQGPFPAEGVLCPPVAHHHPQGPRSTRSTLSRRPPPPSRAALHAQHPLGALEDRSGGTACPLPVPEGLRRGTRPDRVTQNRDRRERDVDCVVASGRSREWVARPAGYANAVPR